MKTILRKMKAKTAGGRNSRPKTSPTPIKSNSALIACLILILFHLSGCNQSAPKERIATPPTAPNVAFEDVTAKAGIHFKHNNGAFGKKFLPETLGSGCAFLDYDNDGWLDILLINGGSPLPSCPASSKPKPMALYRNNRDGTFTDVSKQTGVDITIVGMGVAVGDFDNDGWEDIFISAVGKSRLLHNVPNGKGGRRFIDITEASGINDTGFGTSCAWLDYDRDGKIDLFVCHYVAWSPEKDLFYSLDGLKKSYARPQSYVGETCRLYHNLGKGRFEDVTAKSGILSLRSKALGVAISDFDGDGWPDILVANDTEANCLYHNQGDGTFKEVGVQSGIALSEQGKSRAGMGIDSADTTHKGVFDILITNFAGEQLSLYRRDVSGLYLDVAAKSGVGTETQKYLGFGAFFVDYDLDGWQDIFINNGHIHDDIETREPGVTYAEPALLFRNRGQGGFQDVTRFSGKTLSEKRVGRGAAFGDFDNDGSPDILLMANNGSPTLLHNVNKTRNGWIRIKPVGTVSNRDALGAKVSVRVGKETQTQEVRSGSSYLSSSDRRLTFGLGTATQADHVEIRWPSGKIFSSNGVQKMKTGDTLTIIER